MRLYSIRHMWTGKFLLSSRYKPNWGGSPTYWRRPDTVRKHLKQYASDLISKPCPYTGRAQLVWGNYQPEKLKMVEVVITDVSILGEAALSPNEFLKPNERVAA